MNIDVKYSIMILIPVAHVYGMLVIILLLEDSSVFQSSEIAMGV